MARHFFGQECVPWNLESGKEFKSFKFKKTNRRLRTQNCSMIENETEHIAG